MKMSFASLTKNLPPKAFILSSDNDEMIML